MACLWSSKLRFFGASKRSASRLMSTNSTRQTDELFKYTSGRWLWNEEQQLLERYRYFNASGLKEVARLALRSSSSCISLEKIGEGGFNKVYRLSMQDGQKIIAKIPHPNAGPSYYTTASEVATMDFGRSVLKLPIPKVLGWSSTSNNPVEAEYILMEEAEGTQLHRVWNDMTLSKKRDVILQVVEVEKKLLSIAFNFYGSLYFKSDTVPGTKPATIANDVPQDVKRDVETRFDIGPCAQRELWTKERAHMVKYHGPWSSPAEYLESLVCCEIDWISAHAEKHDEMFHPFIQDRASNRSPQAYVDLLRKLRSVISDIIPRNEDATSSRLWHPDFHSGNIFVDDEGRLKTLIDWQGAWLGPAIINADPPKLLDYDVDMLMKLPDNFKQLQEDEKEKLRYQVSQSILIYAYEQKTANENRLMHKIIRFPNGKTLKETVAFANGTWENGMLPLKDCLIRIQRDWHYFGSDKACPYNFTPAEIEAHQKEARLYNENSGFWQSLRKFVDIDGYVDNEDFPKAAQAFRNFREAGLQELEGPERDSFDNVTRWVLDIQPWNGMP